MIHLCCHVPGASENSTLTLKQEFQSSTSTFILGTPVLAEGLKQCQNLNQPKSNKFGGISIAGGLCFFPRFHIPWGRAGILTIPAEALQGVSQQLALPVVFPGLLHHFIQLLIFILSCLGQQMDTGGLASCLTQGLANWAATPVHPTQTKKWALNQIFLFERSFNSSARH